MIFKLFYIRDFVSAKEYIDSYYSDFDGDLVDYSGAWKETAALIDKIKEIASQRKKGDIFVFWIDALEYGDDECMPFLSGVSGNALTFENAYAMTPYTHPTLRTVFLGLRVVDDMSFKIPTITKENSGLLKTLEAANIDFTYYGHSPYIDQGLKGKESCVKQTPASTKYWNSINDIINSDNPKLCFAHSFWETHNPFLSVDIDNNYYSKNNTNAIEIMTQKETSFKYLDKQLEFYSSLLPESAVKIYMSDHGVTKYGRFHITLKIQGKDIPTGTEQRMFGNINFDKLVNYITDPEGFDYNTLFRNKLDIQDVDYYNFLHIGTALANSNAYKPEVLIGFRGVITQEDIYLRHNHGVEYFHKHVNDGVLFDPERVERLRELAGTGRVDIDKEEKFKYSRYTYKILERYFNRNGKYEEEKTRLIRKLFEDFDEDSGIAIYTGGETSFKLLIKIGLELCRKVKYIIDADSDCIAGKLGIEVIEPSQMYKYPIDIIIKTMNPGTLPRRGIVSYRSKETPPLGAASCTVIDLYEYLEQNGIKCTRDFWMYEHEDSDFDVGFPFLEVHQEATGIKLF